MDRDERCGTCRAFVHEACHRHPPVVVAPAAYGKAAPTYWPPVSENDWCGDWWERPEARDERLRKITFGKGPER